MLSNFRGRCRNPFRVCEEVFLARSEAHCWNFETVSSGSKIMIWIPEFSLASFMNDSVENGLKSLRRLGSDPEQFTFLGFCRWLASFRNVLESLEDCGISRDDWKSVG